MPALPCTGQATLYDLVLFDDAPADTRTQAVHRAAALCATCPTPCPEKVLPPAPASTPTTARRTPTVPDHIAVAATRQRMTDWTEMVHTMAAADMPVSAIAAGLYVSEQTVTALLGRAA
ncbi:hypothetical protein ACF06X_33635 [Streptomyces sp. NPDC015346]|uniref:hypothetical protein n=1 Tax=Streptomyces sp. NPDC015346 TaxID=3364954 RepID=UPI0036FD1F9E